MSHSDNSACWPFIVALYAQPGVAETCLHLQDESSADVPLLLFLVWLASRRGVAINAADLTALQAFVGPWQRDVVTPLRTARRGLKSSDLMRRPVVQQFREGLKRQELEAERTEIALLEEWAHYGGRVHGNVSADHNVALYVATLPGKAVSLAPIIAACEAVVARQG